MRKGIAILSLAMILASPCFANDMSTSLGNSLGSGVSSEGSMNVNRVANHLGNSLISNSLNSYLMSDNAKDWMKRTEVQFTFRDNWKPLYSVETIQPLFEDALSTVFTQFRIANTSEIGTTANLGFGYRKTNKAETNLYGVNVFYDQAFKENHARVGVGAEYFQGYNELRANVYHAVSGEKEIDKVNHIFEKALSGYDAEYGLTLPKAQWAKLYLQGFVWDYKHADDAKGYRVASELQLTPNISTEFGWIKESGRSGEKYVKVMYNLAAKDQALFGGKKEQKPLQLVMRDKRLQKVRRENDIRVERYQKNANGKTGKGLHIKIKAVH